MNAELVIRRRVAYGNRDFAEMVVWRVPEPVPPTTHGFKYRLVYIVDGVRVLGFDNERGKGDHRHQDNAEHPYEFVDVDRLLADFVAAVRQWRTDHDRT
ncbi:toxin-antitoxin system TumE family protein [Azospirillum endophyticum]